MQASCLGDGDLGLGGSRLPPVGESQYNAGFVADEVRMILVSTVNGNEYPPASHGVLLRFGVRDSLVLLDVS